ncbi:cation channel sperm-associated auxiliary subunit beta [Sciurus carolinensis]|uniref:cation channel sperm-associated auxiliary subunit beta n=1 Tax=Sciurus carolinensis TaxID=30640 RepID=UPI001FB3B384|nr:cation channel sperm-associated auxiliary subunit beta [Sciurus carolinensis]
MELSLIYVIILLLNIFEFSSGTVYNKGDKERRFACSSQGYPKENEIIKLFLSLENLIIQCFFQAENEIVSREMLSIFTAGGLAPSLGIINSTYHGIFHFNLTLFSDRVFWLIDIPRENITENKDIAAVEEWLVRITLHKGLNIYATEGTLLDSVREPILQWILGRVMIQNEINTLFPHVTDVKVTKCPCANDVALIGFILNTTYNGVFVGLTSSGFWDYGSTVWYDLTDNIYVSLHEEHSGLSLIDMVLTNHILVVLTSLGLFVSEDLRYPSGQILKLTRADFCGFERVDYIKGKLWYNERCFANKEHFEVDYVTITFDRNRTLSESNSCFFSSEPFSRWLPCLPDENKIESYLSSRVITFLVDQEHNTGIYLLFDKLNKTTIASVNVLTGNKHPNSKPKFPPFLFPSSFSSPVGMVFHPRSHFLYAYGNQVWLSVDGGNTFELLADFHNDIAKNSYHSYYTSDITFACQSGKVYLTKAGLGVYSEIGSIDNKIFALYYDHLGFIHKLTPDHFEDGGVFAGFGNSRSIFGLPPDMGFDTALAPQFLTINDVIFFAYVPLNEPQETIYTKKFSNIHYGKVIHSGKTGKAYIKQIMQHKIPKGFMSSVIAETINPFGLEDEKESSCLSSSLSIEKTTSFAFKLTLDLQTADSSFKTSDIEKTVVIPGYSSFLITEILDDKNALALATMPENIPFNMVFIKDTWFLYNFGSVNGRKWAIFLKPCNYWVQQPDDSLSLNIVKYIDLGNSQVFKIKVIPNSKYFQIIDYPLVEIIVGNPMLLEVNVKGFFDDTHSYLVEISVASRSLRQGSTSLALIIWAAPTECFVTTVVPTLKSSCSYLRSMHHVSSIYIPLEDWIRGVHKDSQGFNMIKTLPANYRPPSNMGIAIPLTDNFYNADPSKPIPRNLFRKSKETGKYKQCAHVSTREECNCTWDQKFSHAVAFSDCKEKVPRFKFPVTQYPITLDILSENEHVPVKSPYLVTVTEVNLRKNWNLKHSVPENVKKLKNHLETILHTSVYNPSGLNLSIKGSELFHFRVTVVPGVTFCNLVEEFQIYVDEVPLPFPGHTLIAVAAAVVLGGLIFTAFMFQLRNIHPWRAFRRWIRRNTLNLSNTNVP